MTRRLGVAVAGLLVACSAVPGAARAGAASAHLGSVQAPPKAANQATLGFVAQDPAVGPEGPFTMRLALRGVPPGDAILAVTVYAAVKDRPQLRAALGGTPITPVHRPILTPIASILRDDQGRFDLRVAITAHQPGPAAAPTTVVLGQTGVYPIEVVLRDGAGHPLDQVASAIVRLAPDPPTHRMAVAVVLGATAPPVHGPDLVPSVGDTARTQIGNVADALAASPATPVTFSGSPELLDGMSQDPASSAVVGRLDKALAGREVLASTYVPLDGPAVVQAGLGSEIGHQLVAGEEALRGALPSNEPDRRSWVETGSLDPATLSELVTLGVNQLVLPSTALSPDPSAATNPLGPIRVRTSTGTIRAATFDADLERGFTLELAPATAATRLYLELALIALSGADSQQGVVIGPPTGTTPSAAFLVDLFNLIGGGPLLQAVSLDDYFRLTPADTDSSGQLTIRSLRPARITPLGSFATTFALLGLETASLTAVVPDDVSLTRDVDLLLLLMVGRELTDPARNAYISAIQERLTAIRAMVSIADQGTVTLTSSTDRIPYVITNSGSYPVHVMVRLESSKIDFPGSTTQGTYDEVVWLPPGTRVNRPQVTARARATFPLTIEVRTPDGRQLLTTTQITVRSTALSGIGIALTIGAAAVLAFWWFRHARRGRRVRRDRSRGEHPSSGGRRTSLTSP